MKRSLIGFLKESMVLTRLSKKINLLDIQLTELYLQLGLLTYNNSIGVSNDTESAEAIMIKITEQKQNIAALVKKMERRGLSRGNRK